MGGGANAPSWMLASEPFSGVRISRLRSWLTHKFSMRLLCCEAAEQAHFSSGTSCFLHVSGRAGAKQSSVALEAWPRIGGTSRQHPLCNPYVKRLGAPRAVALQG
jgi:hypothetical protein